MRVVTQVQVRIFEKRKEAERDTRHKSTAQENPEESSPPPWNIPNVFIQLLIKALKFQSAAGDHVGTCGKLVLDVFEIYPLTLAEAVFV